MRKIVGIACLMTGSAVAAFFSGVWWAWGEIPKLVIGNGLVVIPGLVLMGLYLHWSAQRRDDGLATGH